METTQFIWQNGSFVPWADAKVHVLTHALHYGSGVWEGIRCYETERGTAIFRLQDHIDRLLHSASVLKMQLPWGREDLIAACIETVSRNHLAAGYIRPMLYYGYGKMGLCPIGAPIEGFIACWPWGAYLGGDMVNIRISDFIRIHPRSLQTDAKVSGHYSNSIMASLEVAHDDRFDESLLLDYEGNIAEGPGENIFLVIDGTLHTPQRGTILPGLTRASVIALASEQGIKTVERTIHPDELCSAQEAFFTGTAAEVCGIASVDGKKIGDGTMGPVTKKLRAAYSDLVRGKGGHEEWLAGV